MSTSEPHGEQAFALPAPMAPALNAVAPTAGGHELPRTFAGALAARPRRRRGRVALGVLGAVAAVLVFGGLQLGSNLTFDAAAGRFDSARANALSSRELLRSDVASLVEVNSEAGTILGADSGLLVAPASKEPAAVAHGTATDVIEETESTLETPVPEREDKPTWFWELFGSAAALENDIAEAQELKTELETDTQRVRQTGGALSDSVLTMVSDAAQTAPSFESAHVSAKNLDVIALRDAASATADLSELDATAADAFVALDDAAEQVVASEQAELAEKAGPLQAARLEIEAFARSLAPGVLMDFDWAPLVNGYGFGDSMGGYTSWWYADPGYATLELSNSIAEQWPADRSKAIVAHEVGHAISVKCADMYDTSTADSIEQWATAWAIGMGFTDDANGVWAYGYPPQSYIDAAAGCR